VAIKPYKSMPPVGSWCELARERGSPASVADRWAGSITRERMNKQIYSETKPHRFKRRRRHPALYNSYRFLNPIHIKNGNSIVPSGSTSFSNLKA